MKTIRFKLVLKLIVQSLISNFKFAPIFSPLSDLLPFNQIYLLMWIPFSPLFWIIFLEL